MDTRGICSQKKSFAVNHLTLVDYKKIILQMQKNAFEQKRGRYQIGKSHKKIIRM